MATENSGGGGGGGCSEEEMGHGHYFNKRTFHKPTYCHHCTDMLWGLMGQGYVCEVCNFVVHDRCLRAVVSPCSSIAHNLIKYPVAHCWSEPAHFKRKFCNVCRKRLEDSWAIRCEVCEYYAHLDCQDFVVSDCKHCATYSPNKNSNALVPQYHAWREGNLPGNSKCIVCKKTCWSSECLAGFRCEWCGVTSHAGCYKSLPVECNFGVLRDIMLSPSAVSLPRMELGMDLFMGVQQNTTGLPGRTVSDEWPSSGDSKNEEEPEKKSPKEKEGKDKDKDRDEDTNFESQEKLVRAAGGLATGTGGATGHRMHLFRCHLHKRRKTAGFTADVLRVYDGNFSLKKREYRTVVVSKNEPVQTVLEAALKTFRINNDPGCYYLAEILDKAEGTENILDNALPLRKQLQIDVRRPSIFLRYQEKDPNRGFIKVYPGALGNSHRIKITCKFIPVSKDTIAQDSVHLAIRRFGIDDVDPTSFSLVQLSLRDMSDKSIHLQNSSDVEANQYSLVEMLLLRGVTERTLRWDERPWSIMKQVRKESLHQSEMTRFYLRQTDDPHGPSIALFAGNLPTGLAQRQYEKLLLDIVGKENRWCAVDVIYYEYGALVLLFDDIEKTLRAFNILREAVLHDGKQLTALVLPNLQPHLIPQNIVPLLVFVNVKSGGCQGLELITSFRKLLNPHQVFDLKFGGPLPGLYVFRNVPFYKILVCGGDGTVGWALSCLDNVGQDAECASPPLAIVPLGTGNDLARVLRWGPGYSGAEDPLNLLRDVIDADEISLDRWTVIFHPNEKEVDEMKVSLQNETHTANTTEDNASIFVMNNYFGLGIDADLCLDFHMAREENPDKFNTRIGNKGVYFKMGLRKMVNRKTCKDLHRLIKVEVDGKLIDLPQVEGIIILNILSWASGANPWGPEKEDSFNKPTHYDGMLEIVGVSGVVHMGQIQSGLRSATRIAQGGHIRITLLTDIPVQVDGEPWLQSAGQVVVLRSALKATMLKKSKNKIKRRNTEPSIFFPNSDMAQSPEAESGPL